MLLLKGASSALQMAVRERASRLDQLSALKEEERVEEDEATVAGRTPACLRYWLRQVLAVIPFGPLPLHFNQGCKIEEGCVPSSLFKKNSRGHHPSPEPRSSISHISTFSPSE